MKMVIGVPLGNTNTFAADLVINIIITLKIWKKGLLRHKVILFTGSRIAGAFH